MPAWCNALDEAWRLRRRADERSEETAEAVLASGASRRMRCVPGSDLRRRNAVGQMGGGSGGADRRGGGRELEPGTDTSAIHHATAMRDDLALAERGGRRRPRQRSATPREPRALYTILVHTATTTVRS
jgi:hypothetical protein